ncbi:Fur family transcriptional regulator [Acaryochloris marina]|uniref:Ferric uptake regulation protein n=1 Tax=Acaryochloris marina (strain MBIC 11017) TaxID=329726 RepID=A8ZQ60_ACAM1|nr:Fur family transcriptional regulator [Acaryochloris marina]ABW33105.1 ferric uptake regulation protein [Acaryochloris marina MBIC11017]BDM83264.1 transcriptional repressor [Acaryochloris marina MBIC10699]
MPEKLTPNQRRVLEVLFSTPQEFSAQDLHKEFKKQQQRVGLATVYRALKVLQKCGKVHTRLLQNGEAVYSIPSAHQHHLTCVSCGSSMPLMNGPVHELEKELAQTQKFQVFYHTLEVFGLCQNCIEAKV